MIQEILTYLIILSAGVYIIIRIFRKPANNKSACGGCVSDCSSCALGDLKKEIKKNS